MPSLAIDDPICRTVKSRHGTGRTCYDLRRCRIPPMLRNHQSFRLIDLAGIQYVGRPGISQSCYRALERYLQSGDNIREARILSSRNRHALLLSIEVDECVIVQAGFASGYVGEGPCALAKALHLLQTAEVPIEEVDVSHHLFERLEAGALLQTDLDHICEAAPVSPWRWPDYIYEWRHLIPTIPTDASALSRMPLTMAWSLIDLRLSDLAQEFLDRPEEMLARGFRRLEEVLRQRTGLDEHGTKLLQRAFAGESSKLMWPGIDGGEQTGRAQLFTASFMAFRNPLVHREQSRETRDLLHQFLQLNLLFLLERQSSLRPQDQEPATEQGK